MNDWREKSSPAAHLKPKSCFGTWTRPQHWPELRRTYQIRSAAWFRNMTPCSRMAEGRLLWRITIVSEHDFVCRSTTRWIPRLIIPFLPAQNSPATLHLLDIAFPIAKREL